jgi:hypothetical protein
MRQTKKLSLTNLAYRRLFEQDEEEEITDDTADDAGGDEEGEDDLFGDEEGGDDAEADAGGGDFSGGGGGGGGGSFGGDAGGPDGEGGGAPAEEEEMDVSPEEEYKLSDSIDQELDALMVDFEEEARKSASVNQDANLIESIFLFEEASADIDLRHFAGNIARFIKNYQNLIDWESVILNKTEAFVNNHYGEETAVALFDILEQEYDIEKDIGQKEEAPDAPIAVGATNAGGGGI